MVERSARLLSKLNSWRLIEKNFDGYRILYNQYNLPDLTIFTDPRPVKMQPKVIPQEDLMLYEFLLNGTKPTTVTELCLLNTLLAMDDN